MHARIRTVFLLAATLGACKSVEVPKLPGVTPYRMVIQQGNFISDDMVAQLKPGMTKEQVRFVLGTPLVTDIFHADRWDYVFFREMPNGKREQRNLSVVFQDGKLQRVIGDLLPDPNAPKPAPAAKPEQPKPAPVAKPAAEEPKPAAESKPAGTPKPAQATESWEPTKQNWGSAPIEEPKPAPAAKQEEEKPAAEEKKERGFFGRMWDKVTPGSSQEAKPASEEKPATEPAAASKPAEQPKAQEAKPEEAKPQEPKSEVTEAKQEPVSEEKKERGFFGRMLEKIGL